MNVAVDLHIHTCLSPCADETMTPNNIVNMAMLKGIDIIAITDHNAVDNVRTVMQVAEQNKVDILVVPGIEVQTAEDVHMVCYFDTVDNAEQFGKMIHDSLPPLKNNSDFFGEQTVMDENDCVVSQESMMLAQSSTYTIAEIIELVDEFNGACVPAHIDRLAYGLEGQLGFIPREYHFKTVEVSKGAKQRHLYEESFQTYYSSDAHTIGMLLEREMMIQLKNISIKSFLEWINGTKK